MYILIIPIAIALDHGWITFWEGLLLFFVSILILGAIMPEEKR